MLADALKQTQKRTSATRGIFKSVTYLLPYVLFTQIKKRAATKLPFQHLMNASLAIEEQYRKVSEVYLNKEEQFQKDGIQLDPVLDWCFCTPIV